MKALFFDIDGTLIGGGQSTMSENLMNELKRIKAMGNVLFVATGRPKKMVGPNIYKDIFDGYIFANGGYIEINHQSIYEDRMDPDLLKELVKVLKEKKLEYLIENANSVYMDENYHDLYHFFDMIGNGHIFTYDYDEQAELPTTLKVEVWVSHDKRSELDQSLDEIFHGKVKHDVHGTNNIYEIYPSTLSKAKGIEVVMNHYGIKQEDTYAFGDGTNDLEMIQFAHCGVAMGNAEDVVKEKADLICDSVENDGLAKILKELF